MYYGAVEMDKPLNGTSKFYNLMSALLAFLLWGGWAFYVNGQNDVTIGIISGITQGTASAVITLFMVRAVHWIYNTLPPTGLQVIIPAMLTVSFTGSSLAGIHFLAGTPEILFTILPALTVAFLFCLYTTFKLHRNLGIDSGSAHRE